MAQPIHALLFEAQSIQQYLFDTGQLRDTVGASDLVASLTCQPLQVVWDALDPDHSRIAFSRRLGGAFYAFSSEDGLLEQLADYWTLLLAHYAPGLRYGLGYGTGDNYLVAFDLAHAALTADNNHPRPTLPLAPPVAARSPRTGAAAVADNRRDGLLDAATDRKRESLPNWRDAKFGAADTYVGVTSRFQPEGSGLTVRNWPRDLEQDFPFLGENKTLALIHLDGNGLGQLLQKLRTACTGHDENYLRIYQAFSNGIAAATEAAARHAVATVLLPELADRQDKGCTMLAARPLVLGGDDLTVLVRADLALDFVRTFTSKFEDASRAFMTNLGALGVAGLPDYLTLGGGLVYLQASQPFHLAIQLVEGLADAAKGAVRKLATNGQPQPSTLAFLRVTGALLDDLDETLSHEHTQRTGDKCYHDRMTAWSLHADAKLPALDNLLVLQRLLASAAFAHGPLRQLLTLLGEAPEAARERYRRWRQLMVKNRPTDVANFDRVLGRFGITPDSTLPYAEVDGAWCSPLGDAIALNAAGSRVVAGSESADQLEVAA